MRRAVGIVAVLVVAVLVTTGATALALEGRSRGAASPSAQRPTGVTNVTATADSFNLSQTLPNTTAAYSGSGYCGPFVQDVGVLPPGAKASYYGFERLPQAFARVWIAVANGMAQGSAYFLLSSGYSNGTFAGPPEGSTSLTVGLEGCDWLGLPPPVPIGLWVNYTLAPS